MAIDWRVYGKDTVVCKLDKAELPGFFTKTIVVQPNEAAVVVKDGRTIGTVTQTRHVATGLWDSFMRMFGGGTDIAVYFVDTTPFEARVFLGKSSKSTHNQSVASSGSSSAGGAATFGRAAEITETAGESLHVSEEMDVSDVTLMALSADKEVISAECVLRFSVMPEDAPSLVGLLKGRRALATWDLVTVIKSELLAKVLLPRISTHQSGEFRGNRALLAGLEAETRQELTRSFSTWGLMLETFVINWGLTDTEIAEIERKRQQREEEALQFTHGRKLGEMQRELDISRAHFNNLHELKTAEARGDQQLEVIYLAGEVERGGMLDGQRLNTARVDVQIRKLDLEVKQLEQDMGIERIRREQEIQTLAEQKQTDDDIRAFDAVQKAKQERMRLDQDFKNRQMDTQTQSTERLLDKALEKGIADAETLREMMRQQTLQKALDRSNEKVDSLSQSDAAKANMQTFRDAEDRERRHQVDMTGQAANLMDASKQDLPRVLYQGGGTRPSPERPAPSPNPPPGCPSCGKDVQAGWKLCAWCGVSLAPRERRCANCNNVLQPGWAACPFCGTKA